MNITDSTNYLNNGEENDFRASCQQLFVDIHCHCLAAVDDGPSTIADSIALCRALAEDGINTAIATPHQLGRFSGYNEAPLIREIVSSFNEELKRNDVALSLLPGADVRVDERICQLLEADKILTLADGGKYILLELPQQVFIDITPLLNELSSLGIQAIISHPERHPVFVKHPNILIGWLAHPVHLQITAGSLLGEFGLTAQKAAWNFLSSGWVELIATDSHDLDGRRPRMKAAFERINTKLGHSLARLVCIENPSRVLNAQEIIPAYPVSQREHINETVPTSY